MNPDDRPVALPPFLAPLIVLLTAFCLHAGLTGFFSAYTQHVAMDVGIAITLAVSLNIVNGYTGQFSIGHAAFYAIGGYAAAIVTYYGSLLIWNSSETVAFSMHAAPHWLGQIALFIVATIFGGLTAAIAGWLVGLPSLRLRGDYLAIVTLGFGEIMRVLLQQTNTELYSREEIRAATWGQLIPPPVGGSLGFIDIPKFTTPFWAALFAGITLVVAWRLKRSTFGRAMIAIRENEIAAEAMGVNVTRLKVWAFVFAAFFAGVAGSLYAHESGTQITPTDAGFVRSFDIVIMVVLGGLGSISGAAMAAAFLVIANEWLRGPTHVWHIGLVFLIIRLIVWPSDRIKAAAWWIAAILAGEAAWFAADHWGIQLGDYRMIFYALLLICVMIVRPSGLFGTREISDVFRLRRNLRREQRGFEVTSAEGKP